MAHFTKVKTPKGATRYVTRWSENGKTRQKNFLTQKEAKHYSVEMEQKLGQRKKLRHKEYLRIGDIDFRQVAKKFLAEKKNPVRGDPVEPITLRGYKSYLKEHIYPATDGYYIRGIAATHFERAFDLAAKKQCSPKTKREILRLMTAVLKHAQGLGYIESVPTHTVEIRPTRAEKIKAKLDADKKPYSPNEIYSLLRAADSLAMDENRQTQKVWARYRPMVYFLTYTGARISETRGFPRADYEKETGFIRISQSAPETGAVGNVKAVDSIRRIPLNPALIEPLDEALARHDRSLVFGTLTNMPISKDRKSVV